MQNDKVWLEWLAKVMELRPKDNWLLISPRGMQATKLCLEIERNDFNWHRGDEDAFWIDVQLFVKYNLSDDEIRFMMRQQPGCDNYQKHSAERNAYAEMMRGMKKLREILAKNTVET